MVTDGISDRRGWTEEPSTALINCNPIPGNINLYFSAESIDRKGIQPDILIYPTVKGLQSGKDEVLERAINFIQTGN